MKRERNEKAEPHLINFLKSWLSGTVLVIQAGQFNLLFHSTSEKKTGGTIQKGRRINCQFDFLRREVDLLLENP